MVSTLRASNKEARPFHGGSKETARLSLVEETEQWLSGQMFFLSDVIKRLNQEDHGSKDVASQA